MSFATWLPDTLRAAGLVVVELPGWQTRSTRSGGFTENAVICHHTATSVNTSNERVANLLRDGRSDLKGPLSQLGLDRDGHFWMIAAGRCNHNGFGRWGNDSIGIEAFNDGRGEPWPAKQVDAYAKGVAAILTRTGLDVSRCLGHKESDPGRKIDPTFDMVAFRGRVAALMEDDMDETTLRKIVREVVADELGSLRRRVGTDNEGRDLSDEIDGVLRNQRRIGAAVGVTETMD